MLWGRRWEQGPSHSSVLECFAPRVPPEQGEPGQPWRSNTPVGGLGRELCSHRFSQRWIA